jgi:hypothetical protein
MALPSNRTLAMSEINKGIQFTNGNVGIGTTSPSAKLDVSGSAIISTGLSTGTLLTTHSSGIQQTSHTGPIISERSYTTTTGSLTGSGLYGVFKASSTQVAVLCPQNVHGAEVVLGTILDDSTIVNAVNVDRFGDLHVNSTAINLDRFGFITASSGISTGTVSATNTLTAINNSNTIGSIITTGGNVGVGTTSPSYKLDVSGSARIGDTVYVGGSTTANIIAFHGTAGDSSGEFNQTYIAEYNIGASEGPINELLLFKGTDGGEDRIRLLAPEFRFDTSTGSGGDINSIANFPSTNRFIITTSGNVGIGTSTPSFTLDVNGSARFVSGITTGNIQMIGQSNIYVDDDQFLRFGANQPYLPQVLVVGSQFSSLPGRVNFRYNSYIAFENVDGVSTLGTTEKMRLTSSGNLGIGTTSPAYTLEVNGTARFSTGITTGTLNSNDIFLNQGKSIFSFSNTDKFVHNNNTVGHYSLSWPSDSATGGNFAYLSSFYGIKFFTGGQNRLLINRDGNVGIGTTSPAYTLHVNGSTKVENEFVCWGGGFFSGITTGNILASNYNFIAENSAISLDFGSANQRLALVKKSGSQPSIATSNNAPILFQVANSTSASAVSTNTYTTILTLTTGGSLGIGTTNPAYILDTVSTSNRHYIKAESTDTNSGAEAGIRFKAAGTNGKEYVLLTENANGSLRVFNASSSTTPLILNSSGRLYLDIGLDVINGTNGQTHLSLGGMNYLRGNTYLDSATETRIRGNGMTYVGDITSGDGRLNVRDFAGTCISFYLSDTKVGSITVSGASTSYNTSSDYRLKENVVPLTNALSRVSQIPVHRFNFISTPDTTVDGFIAHEVAAVVPEAIHGEKDAVDDDDNIIAQGIDQSKLVPLLTAAIKELKTELDAIKTHLGL